MSNLCDALSSFRTLSRRSDGAIDHGKWRESTTSILGLSRVRVMALLFSREPSENSLERFTPEDLFFLTTRSDYLVFPLITEDFLPCSI